MYDIEEVKKIPIEEVCNSYGIPLNKKGQNLWGSIRNEKTPSFSINPQKNIWRDWGMSEGGGVIDLVVKMENVEVGQAIKILGDRFGLVNQWSNEVETNKLLPTKSQFEKIGIVSDRVMSNFDLNAEKQSVDKLVHLDEKYSGSMYDLSKENPVLYHKLIDKKAMPIINELRNSLLDNLNKYKNENNQITKEFYKDLIKDSKNNLNLVIDIYNRARLDDITKDNLKISIDEDLLKISNFQPIKDDIPFRYYLTQRPPSIGTHPRGTINVVSFDNKKEFEGINCWGFVEYDKALTESQVQDYELILKENTKISNVKNIDDLEREINDIMEKEKNTPLIDMKIDKDVDVNEIVENLKNGVGNIFQNEKFIEYLNFQSNFHNYSPNNNLLISLQNPTATNVASFTRWNALGRSVNKGEKGIMILAPNVVKNGIKEIFDRLDKYNKTYVGKYLFTKKNNAYNIFTNGKPVSTLISKNELESFMKINKLNQTYINGFRKTYVFDISQTSGKEIPQFKLQLKDNALLDEKGFYKNPLIKIQFSEGGVFKSEQLLTFKQANEIFERKEKEVRELKQQYESKGEYYPYLKQKFDVILKPSSPLDGVARNIRVDIGDGEYNNLLEALKVEMKGYPHSLTSMEQILNSNDKSMETILAIKNQLEKTIADKGISLEYINNTGNAKGYFSPNENKICVNSELGLSQTTKTLVHEYVHSQLHSDGIKNIENKDNLENRQVAEIEAEGSAYVISKHFGFDTSEYSFDYVSSWARGREVSELSDTLKCIKSTSEKIINEIKAPLELELYNNKETMQEILKAENVKPSDKIINNMIDINRETGKINDITDLSNAEKFKTYAKNPELSGKIIETNKDISENIVKTQIKQEVVIER